jgi:hypothetical protein
MSNDPALGEHLSGDVEMTGEGRGRTVDATAAKLRTTDAHQTPLIRAATKHARSGR